MFSVAEYEQITEDEFQIHLFIESTDPQMARMAMDLLKTENPTMQCLKVKVKEIENSVWYNQKKKYGKLENFRKEKFLKPSNSKIRSAGGLASFAEGETIRRNTSSSRRI